jgi:hypothetical protein
MTDPVREPGVAFERSGPGHPLSAQTPGLQTPLSECKT